MSLYFVTVATASGYQTSVEVRAASIAGARREALSLHPGWRVVRVERSHERAS